MGIKPVGIDNATGGFTNSRLLAWLAATFASKSHTHVIGDLPVAASGVSDATKLVRSDDSRLSGGGGSVSDATTTAKGVVQLAGDLGGTAAAPTVPGLAGKAPLASPAFTGTPTGISKAHVGLGNVDNTSDANKPVSTAQAAADALAVPKSLVTAKGDLVAATGNATPARVGVGSNGQVLTADSTQSSGVKWATPFGGGGSAPVMTAALIRASTGYRLPDVADNGDDGTPVADEMGCLITYQPVRMKVKSLLFNQTALASAAAPIQIVLYDAQTGGQVANFGTIDLATGAGLQTLTLGAAVEIPQFAVWAVKLLAASANGGRFRRAVGSVWHCVGNVWDGPTMLPRSYSLQHTGTGPMPATLPTTVSGSSAFPFFAIVPEAA